MDSGALLDLLGNENRRRILRLLAQKPCYVTEISEYLDVSPKAVIDHLRRLEEAGLIRSRTDEHRRKYFYIANDVRLEVNVSRYGFGTKSAYPARTSLDLTTCKHVSIELDGVRNRDDDITSLATDLKRLEELENELSLAQRYVQGRLIETIDRVAECVDAADNVGLNGRLAFDILLSIASGQATTEAISMDVDVPPDIVEDALEHLLDHGIVERGNDAWTITSER